MDMKCYYGEVHAHTTESDGKGTPVEAYAYARDVGHADYFATTDHNISYNAQRMDYVGTVADAANEDGKFAALYGYEMTYETNTGHYGHANILQPKKFLNTNLTLDEWYDTMAKIGETGLGQFNHPGEKWGNFNEFVFDPRMDDLFRLIELRITEYGITCIEEEYDRALRKGWHISPVSNEDTHSKTWTTTREETGAVLAESLSRETVLDAMRKNRTFATTDRTFKLFYKANGEWMGARLKKTGTLKVEIEASTEKEGGVGVLQLVGEHNRVLAQIDAGKAKSFRWEVTIPDDQRYTYVKRISAMQYAISGAVWVEQNTPLSVELDTSYQDGGMVAVADVKNTGEKEITDLVVEWYPAAGSIEQGAKPFVSKLASIKAGDTARAAFRAPVLAKNIRLVAVVKGLCNEEAVTVSDVIYLSPLTIQRFFCNTNDFSASNYQKQQYCCYDLYNNTDAEIDLSEYIFRYYLFGTYREYRIPRKLAPHGLLTVWMRGKGGDKTLADFNDFYGTELTEEQVYCCPLKYEPDEHTRKITIGYGDEVCCRAWIRSDGYHNADISNRDCFTYEWLKKTSTMGVCGIQRTAKPHVDAPAIPAALEVPSGAALAEYQKPVSQKIRRLTVLSDGGTDADSLVAKARKLFPEAEQICPVIGDHDGSINLLTYLYQRNPGLINDVVDTHPDAVLVAMGATDCGKNRSAWFDHNFYGYPTVMVYATRSFYVRNIPMYFTMPTLNEEQKVDQNILAHQIRSIADTLYAEQIDVPEEMISTISIDPPTPRLVPREGAIRVAVIGERFSERNYSSTPYALDLQKILGEDYDVRLYAKNAACVTRGLKNNFLKTGRANLRAMKEFAPQIIISWFGCSDLRHAYADRWESFKPDFEAGYAEFLEEISSYGGKVMLVTPFDRLIPDSRQAVNRQKGGMVETILRMAEERGMGVIDFFKVTNEEEGLIVPYRDMDILSPEGVKRLAELAADAVRSCKLG